MILTHYHILLTKRMRELRGDAIMTAFLLAVHLAFLMLILTEWTALFSLAIVIWFTVLLVDMSRQYVFCRWLHQNIGKPEFAEMIASGRMTIEGL